MKKSFIASAVAAGLLASGAAQAEPTVYGILHLSIDAFSDDHYASGGIAKPGSPEMNSNTSAIGVKGSEDLGNGLKAIYKAEWKVEPFAKAGLERRDIWIGLKGGWGKLAAGTMSSNYKQMGGKIDPLYRTVAEGRGILNMQSRAHKSAGIDGGRMTQALQYTTPKMGGFTVVLNTSISAADAGGSNADEALGAGIRWSNKSFLVYADYFDPSAAGTTGNDESIAKIGGKWSNKTFQVGAQYEATEDQFGGDYMYLNGLWNINKNNAVTASYGAQDKVSDAYALAYVHVLGKQSNVYVGYGSVSADSTGSYSGIGFKDAAETIPHEDGSVITLGMRKSF